MGPNLYWYSLCTVVLFLKMFGVSAYQGYHRLKSLTFHIAEDAAFVGKPPLAEELPPVRRAAQCWRNDLENIPAFFALGIVYVLTGASPAAAPWLFITFTVARTLHTTMYLLGIQPWRTVAYAVAIVCLLGMCTNIVAVVL